VIQSRLCTKGAAIVVAAGAVVGTLVGWAQVDAGRQPGRDPQIGQAFSIPYQLTETNHFLVRVRLNGKGPFNFLVDSGAPALIIATRTAAKIGLKSEPSRFWTPVKQLDLEGGARLNDLKARIEDPFQLVGMNALGLPGATIDGIMGFTILARFRLEIDPTSDRMTWTRLDYVPPDPPVPDLARGEGPPPQVQAMDLIGPLAKGLAFFLGKQPEPEIRIRGFLGLTWTDPASAQGHHGILVKQVLPESAASQAGLQAGDRILKIQGHPVDSPREAAEALKTCRSGDVVKLEIQRGQEAQPRIISITARRGL